MPPAFFDESAQIRQCPTLPNEIIEEKIGGSWLNIPIK